MNIQLNDVVQAEEVLLRLFQTRPERATDTFRLAQLKRALVPLFEDYFEARMELLERYGHMDKEIAGRYEFIRVDEDGKPLLDCDGDKQTDGEAIENFDRELQTLLDEEVEVVVKPLTLSIIDSIGLVPALSVDEMESLMWLLKEREQ